MTDFGAVEFQWGSEQILVVVGNVAEGFKFYGPFDDPDDAIEFAEQQGNASGTKWDVIPVQNVNLKVRGDAS